MILKHFSYKISVVVFSVVLFLLIGSGFNGDSYTFDQINVEAANQIIDEQEVIISPGLVEQKMHIEDQRGNQRISVLNVNLAESHLELSSSIPSNGYPNMEKLSEQAQFLTEESFSVIGGVNGDFFNTSTGETIGLYVHNSELLHPGSRERPALGVTEEGEPIIGYQTLEWMVSVDEQNVLIDTVNEAALMDHTLNLYTDEYTDSIRLKNDDQAYLVEGMSGEISEIGSITATCKVLSNDEIAVEEEQMILVSKGNKNDAISEACGEGSIDIETRFNEPWNNIKHAVGGNLILVESGEIPPLEDNSFNETVAPRTAAGIKSDGTMFFVVVDGRMPGYSEGVDIFELADIMKEMGAVDAINLDGGGSSTMISRLPGEEEVSVTNRPSDYDDGSEREVANGMFIINHAQTGVLNSIVISPSHLLMLVNSSIQLEAKGIDETYNPVSLEDEIKWSVDHGDISNTGVLTAAGVASNIHVKAQSENVEGDLTVEVIDTIDDIQFSQSELNMKRGEEVNLLPKVYKDGREVFVTADALEWSVSENVGEVTDDGTFIASSDVKQGEVTVSYGDVAATIKIDVGRLPVILADFEDGIEDWESSGASYSSIHVEQSTYPEPVRFGKHALKIDYDFTDMPGTSGVYAHPNEPIEIEGYPNAIGMWVYGDGNNHWLRSQLLDGNNNAFQLDFADELDWEGWRYVEAEIPGGKETPLKLDLPVRYMEIDQDKKDKGTIYIDNIRAVYSEVDDDLEAPIIKEVLPKENSLVSGNNLEVEALIIDDKSGVNPDSLELFLNGEQIEDDIVYENNKIYYQTAEIIDGEHTLSLLIQDHAGNLTAKDWSFEYKEEKGIDDDKDEGENDAENETSEEGKQQGNNENTENDDEDKDKEIEESVTENEKEDSEKEDMDNQLPNTSTNIYTLLLIGFIMFLTACMYWIYAVRRRNMN